MSDATPVNKHKWDREQDNFYVEPEWVTYRLCQVEKFEGMTVDPCAGGGNVVRGARSAGVMSVGSDLRERGVDGIEGGKDFFDPDCWVPGCWPVSNIISNPPYGRVPKDQQTAGYRDRLEERFVELALERTTCKVAAFLSAQWANGEKRGAWLETLPLYRIYKVGPRPACPPGHLYYGEKANVGNGTTDFAWYVFLNGFQGAPTLHWLRRDD